jgi:hypothetical protein
VTSDAGLGFLLAGFYVCGQRVCTNQGRRKREEGRSSGKTHKLDDLVNDMEREEVLHARARILFPTNTNAIS